LVAQKFFRVFRFLRDAVDFFGRGYRQRAFARAAAAFTRKIPESGHDSFAAAVGASVNT
jgi:hypothetical protein